MAHPSLLPLAQASDSRRRVGVKASRLVFLQREGRDAVPIVPTWVLDVDPFREVIDGELPSGHDPRSLLKLGRVRVRLERSARARERILEAKLPETLEAALDEWLASVREIAPWGVAVRASPTCDNQVMANLAGLSGVVLGVVDRGALLDAVRLLWSTVFFPRTLEVLIDEGAKDVAMAIVLQPVVVADASGVMITRPPLGLQVPSWRIGDRMVRARPGLGAPNQRPELPSDLLCVSRGGAETVRVIARKPSRVWFDGSRISVAPVALPDAPAITPGALRALTDLAEKLERIEAGPWTVDFARVGDEIVVLSAQLDTGKGARPSTALWSRSNLGGLGQALTGLPAPLLWSVAAPGFEREFRHAFSSLGCSVPRSVRLVSNLSGRLYVNLSEWVRAAAQVPGLDPRALLSLGGGVGADTLERQLREVSHRGFYARLPLTLARLLTEQTRLGNEVEQFHAAMGRARTVFRDLDLAILPDDSFLPTLRDVRTLLERAGSLLLSGSLAYLTSHLALTSVIGRALPQSAASAAQALSTGVDPLSTVTPALDLAAIAGASLDEPEAARALDALLRDALAQLMPNDEVTTLAGPPSARGLGAPGLRTDAPREGGVSPLPPRVTIGYATSPPNPASSSAPVISADEILARVPPGATRRAIVRFFASHGHRSVGEEDLTQPRWRENATHVLAMLASLRRLPASVLRSPESVLGRGRAVADRELARLEGRLSIVELGIVRALAERAQRFSKLREALWSSSSDALAMARAVALEIDRRLLRVNPRLEPGAVFYCTHEEIMAAVATGRPEVDHLVNLRRAEHDRDVLRADPPPVYLGAPVPFVVPPGGDTVLRGMPASPGVVRGTARILREMDATLSQFQPGDILVTRTLDLGLAPLLLVAGAVVTEQGGPLAHALVVVRALGLPAVVHVAAATLAFRTGDTLRVDGDIGVVEKVMITRTDDPHGDIR